MVEGLTLFRERFAAHAEKYVLIGGAACDLLMDEAGLPFRATKDLDIVLVIEALDGAFVRDFLDFVRAGAYQVREKSSGEPQFYRFHKPQTPGYPHMLELFSRRPEALGSAGESQLTPIPVGDEVSSLSAILLDDDYYRYIHAGRRELQGVPVIGPERIIPLKAKAWLDLSGRRAAGETVDSKDIRKHKNDVFRLWQIVDPARAAGAPDAVKADLRAFLAGMEREEVDLKPLGIRQSREAITANLRLIYELG